MNPNSEKHMSIEDALEHCLTQLATEEISLEACLAQYPAYADELRPLLQTAQVLHLDTTIAATPQQIQAMENRILAAAVAATAPHPTKTVPFRLPFQTRNPIFRLAAAGIFIFILVALLLTLTQDNQNPDSGDVLGSAVQHRTDTPLPSNLALASFEIQDEVALPIIIILEGKIENIDSDHKTITLKGIQIQVRNALRAADVELMLGQAVMVEGQLLNDGTIIAGRIQAADENTTNASDTACIGTDGQPCHAVLLTLAEFYNRSYTELDMLFHDGFGIGEIARLLALTAVADVEFNTLATQRDSGMSWEQIIAAHPTATRYDFTSGLVIRQLDNVDSQSNPTPS